MHTLISDEMLETFAVIAAPDELPYKLRERYARAAGSGGLLFSFSNRRTDTKRIIWRHAAEGDGSLMPSIELGKGTAHRIQLSGPAERAKRISVNATACGTGLEVVYPPGLNAARRRSRCCSSSSGTGFCQAIDQGSRNP